MALARCACSAPDAGPDHGHGNKGNCPRWPILTPPCPPPLPARLSSGAASRSNHHEDMVVKPTEPQPKISTTTTRLGVSELVFDAQLTGTVISRWIVKIMIILT